MRRKIQLKRPYSARDPFSTNENGAMEIGSMLGPERSDAMRPRPPVPSKAAAPAPSTLGGIPYQKLQGSDIRLLTIDPSSTSTTDTLGRDEPVRCTLKHYSFNPPSTSTELSKALSVYKNPWSDTVSMPKLRIKEEADEITKHMQRLLLARKPRIGPKHRTLLSDYDAVIGRWSGQSQEGEVSGRYPWGDYVALSYTWGDPDNTREIVVNGKSVQVTVNLEAALRVLRNKAPVQAGLKLWTDALCINQNDDVEKGVQVKRMGEIYRRAFDVVVWIGPEAEESWKAFKLIEILAESWRKDKGKYLRKYLDSDDHSLFQMRPADEPSLLGCWHALRNLMFRPYWKRVWIIQELLMSKDTSPVLCGQSVVQLRELQDALCNWIGIDGLNVLRRYMIFERLQLGASMRPKVTPGGVRSMQELADKYGGLSFNPTVRQSKGLMDSVTIKDWQIDAERLNFIGRLKNTAGPTMELNLHPVNLVTLGRQSEAGRDHDKVYAFLGLMDPGFTAKVTVDYKQSVRAAYTNFSVQWMLETGSLDILTSCEIEDGQNPTWVPDWRNGDFQPLLYTGDHKNKYCAGGEYADNLAIRPDLKLVECHGVLLDEIDGLSATAGETAASIRQPLVTANAYSDADEFRDSLWRTFLGNRTFEFEAPNPYTSYGDEFRALLDIPLPQPGGHLPAPYDQEFYTFIETNSKFLLAGRPLEKYFANDGRREPISNDPTSVRMMKDALLDSVMRATWMLYRRRLITTKKGLIGVVPRAAKRRDRIAVLQGCREPLVLRAKKVDGEVNYQVVGTCYVHGFMEGELLKIWDMPGFNKRSIYLC